MLSRSNADNLTRPGRRIAKHDVVRIAAGPWAGRVGVVEATHGKRLTVRIDPKWTKAQAARISDEIAELRREGMKRAQAVRVAFAEERERTPGMKFLINPPEEDTMPRRDPRTGRFVSSRRNKSRRKNPRRTSSRGRAALRRAAEDRPRDSRGRFLPEGGRRRRNPSRRASSRRHSSWSPSKHPRNRFGEFVSKGRSRRHRNPPMRDIPGMLVNGTIGAVEGVLGKAVTKTLPGVLKLPTTGNVGLAIQMLTAVVLGWAADEVAGEHMGEMVLVGGLMAPIETAVENAQLPYLAPMLQQGTLQAWSAPMYVEQPASSPPLLSAWSQPAARFLES